MDTLDLLGLLENAAGATIIISIAGPNHYNHTQSFEGTFDLPIPVTTGRYDILVSAFTDGDFTFDVKGTFQSVTPNVPLKFGSNRQPFTVII